MRTPPWQGVAVGGLPQGPGLRGESEGCLCQDRPTAIPAGSVPTEAPDGPGRTRRSLTGRLRGLAARQDASCLLVSYSPLVSCN